jgi:hypothetical protein
MNLAVISQNAAFFVITAVTSSNLTFLVLELRNMASARGRGSDTHFS